MRKSVMAILLLLVGCGLWAQSTGTRADDHKKQSSPTVDELKQMLAAQQAEIEKLRQAVDDLKAAKEEQPHAPSLGTVASTAPMLPAGKAPEPKLPSVFINNAAQDTSKPENPTSLRYKGVTITPVGFLAAEGVWRQHALLSDVNTPFNSTPYAGADQAHINDLFFSGRQSRLGVLVEGKLSMVKLSGYYETDWLSAGVTSNNNQSNSYTNRQRQIWGQAALDNGWTFTGGQMWSLATETKKGLDNRTEALPMTIDAQYHVGFSWERQFGFRVTKNFNNKAWLGMSVENPQDIFTAHGNATNFDLGGPGTGGGLYNLNANYSFNKTPDFIFKTAFEPGWGHYELFGILSTFQDRVYPNATATPASAAGAFNSTKTGGGMGANFRGTIAKHLDIGAHFLAGDGIDRYGTSTLPDATVHPDGTLALVHGYMGLATVEYHTPKWDWYWNLGTEYAARTWYLNAAGKPVGYGAPGFTNSGCATEVLPGGGNGFTPGAAASCTGDTKDLVEGSMGFWYKWYVGAWGRLQWGLQGSYIRRTGWPGAGATAGTFVTPRADEPMVFASFRYYIP
ncbi:MAG: hypothetical protein JO041_03215 [Acidobacteria bacterium]|nr:hypothetical protein [Acidobacteriota bacterium]